MNPGPRKPPLPHVLYHCRPPELRAGIRLIAHLCVQEDSHRSFSDVAVGNSPGQADIKVPGPLWAHGVMGRAARGTWIPRLIHSIRIAGAHIKESNSPYKLLLQYTSTASGQITPGTVKLQIEFGHVSDKWFQCI